MTNTTVKQSLSYHLGIDISKQWLDCWLRPTGTQFHCNNDQKGFDQLHQWLLAQRCSQSNSIICFENTGVYGQRLWCALYKLGWTCTVEKTTVLDKVGPEHHRKDDVFDAQLPAEYADRFSDQLNIQVPREQPVAVLRQLYCERRRLVNAKTATLNKQQADQHVYRSVLLDELWQEQLDMLNKQIARLDKKMKGLIDAHKGLTAYYELLVSIRGIGKVTATLWLTFFYGK